MGKGTPQSLPLQLRPRHGRHLEAKARELTDPEKSEITDAFVQLYRVLIEEEVAARSRSQFRGRTVHLSRP
jgi:hypothetical protein